MSIILPLSYPTLDVTLVHTPLGYTHIYLITHVSYCFALLSLHTFGWYNNLFVPIMMRALLKPLFLYWEPTVHCAASGAATHPADDSGCVLAQRWSTLCQHTNTQQTARTQTQTHSLHVPFCACLWMEEATGTLACLFLAAAVLFCRVTSPTVSPSCFYQVTLSGRKPPAAALFIPCYWDRGIGSPDHHFDDLQEGGKTLRRSHLLSPVHSQMLWSSSWTQES